MGLGGLSLAAIILSFHCVFAKYASDCVTIENEIGKCMPVKSCRTTYTMLRTLLNSDEETYNRTVSVLKQSQCGYENGTPFVCCLKADIQMNPEIYEYLSQLHCGEGFIWRIAFGKRADIYDFRWMALLAYGNDDRNIFRCGGSLISERHILTAAHCLQGFREIPVGVRLGEYDLSTETDCVQTRRGPLCIGPYEDIGIEKIYIPDNYIYGGLHHDIALLRLSKSVGFKKHIMPICLPINKELQSLNTESYLVAGWGRTQNSQPSNMLLYTNIPHRDLNFCRQRLRLPLNDNLTIGHICAGGESYRDSCKGDSGGPLLSTEIYTDGVARSVQMGVISSGVISCGEVSLPAIYTNVSHYMQWITDHMSIS